MKTFVRYILFFTFWITLVQCKKEDSPKVSRASVRIHNSTPWKFYQCIIDPTNTLSYTPTINAHEFGEINNGSTSAYYKFPLPKVYRYSWAKIEMNNQFYYLLPFDYFGETPLSEFFYTYKITYDSTFDRLDMELIVD